MENSQKQALLNSQRPDLELIRLEAESLVNQIYFLEEALAGLAHEGRTGRQLHPLAIRGLCAHLQKMEEQASDIFSRTCEMLGVSVDTVAEEWL